MADFCLRVTLFVTSSRFCLRMADFGMRWCVGGRIVDFVKRGTFVCELRLSQRGGGLFSNCAFRKDGDFCLRVTPFAKRWRSVFEWRLS